MITKAQALEAMHGIALHIFNDPSAEVMDVEVEDKRFKAVTVEVISDDSETRDNLRSALGLLVMISKEFGSDANAVSVELSAVERSITFSVQYEPET